MPTLLHLCRYHLPSESLHRLSQRDRLSTHLPRARGDLKFLLEVQRHATSSSLKRSSDPAFRTSTSGSSSRSPGPSTAGTGSSSEASLVAPRATVSRPRAVAPAPVSKPPKPSQTQPFEPNTIDMPKNKKKALSQTRRQGTVENDEEEAERSAAMLSPPKQGARVTSEVCNFIMFMSFQFSQFPSAFCLRRSTSSRSNSPGFRSTSKSRLLASQEEKNRGPLRPAPLPSAMSTTTRADESSVSTSISALHLRSPFMRAAQHRVPKGEESETANPSQGLQVPKPKQSRSKSCSPSPARYRLEDLPEHNLTGKRWKKYFVPTLLCFQGAQSDPWSWTDMASVTVVQKIWDHIFGGEVPHKIVMNECVHFFGMWFSYRCVTFLSSPSYQASQKLWDWRSSLCHTAEVVANRYLDANSLTREVGN